MFSQFLNILNGLKSLGKAYPNGDLVNKILRSLSKSQKPKVTARQEAKDEKTLHVDYLLNSLITHEKMIDEDPNKKRKCIAFKAKTESEEELDEKNWFYSLELRHFFTKITNGRIETSN